MTTTTEKKNITGNWVSTLWDKEDVLRARPDLTDDQAREVLGRLIRHHCLKDELGLSILTNIAQCYYPQDGIQRKTLDLNDTIRDLLVETRQIAHIWCVEDVQHVRSDLTEEEAWEVLELVDRKKDDSIGVSWETLEIHADILFPLS